MRQAANGLIAMPVNTSAVPKRTNRWRPRLNTIVALLILGSLAYCTSLYATAEKRVSRVCAMLTPGMNYDAVDRIATANGMSAPQHAPTSDVVESATFGRYGCRLRFKDGVLQTSSYEFQD